MFKTEASAQRQRIEEHISGCYGTPAEHLWERYSDYAVFRHPASRKWFAAIMNIPAQRLGLEGERCPDVINLKCGPILLGSLLGRPGFLPAYHMSKANWVTVLLDGTVPDAELFSLLEISFDSVAPRRRPRA